MLLMLKARTKIFLLFVAIVMGVLAVFNYAIFSLAEADWQDKKMSIMKSDMHSMLSLDEAKKKLKNVCLVGADGVVNFRSGVFEQIDSLDGIQP